MTTSELLDLNLLPSYLDSSPSWTLERGDDRRRIYVHIGQDRVFIPMRAGPDFNLLTSTAIGEIAAAEKRDPDELLVDLEWSQFDKVVVQRKVESSSLRYRSGLDFHEGLGTLIRSAALAEREAQPSYPGGPPSGDVGVYLHQVRMIPSMPGSFVIRALVPAHTQVNQQLQLELEEAPEPSKARAMTAMIATAASSAVSIATEVAHGAPIELLREGVASGVSSNLCAALSSLIGKRDDSGNVEVHIRWTWATPTEPIQPVTIPRELADTFDRAADFLKEEVDPSTIEMAGIITTLHRDTTAGPGDITVKSYGMGRTREVRFRLSENQYQAAIDTHNRGKQVTLTGRSINRSPQIFQADSFLISQDS